VAKIAKKLLCKCTNKFYEQAPEEAFNKIAQQKLREIDPG